MDYARILPQGTDNKASGGFLYLPGGSCVRGGDPMTEEAFKRKLTAILSADVEGYTRLMSQDEVGSR